jgi:hypothetical protein
MVMIISCFAPPMAGLARAAGAVRAHDIAGMGASHALGIPSIGDSPEMPEHFGRMVKENRRIVR